MALTNLAVTCGYMGPGDHALPAAQPVFGRPAWSENLAAGTTTQAAPVGPGQPVFQVVAAADSWVVTGATALDASKAVSTKKSEARIFIKAATVTNIYVNPGDKLAWIAA